MRAPLSTMFVTNPFLAPGYGVFGVHAGIDLRASVGTNVYAPADGVVTESYIGSNGIQVLSARIEGKEWRFLHLSKRLLSVGQKFSEGQVIAKTGNSGNVAAHLHVDIRKPGTAWNHSINDYYNPLSIINASAGGTEMFNNEAEVQEAYQMLRGKNGTSAEAKSWVGLPKQRFFQVGKPEADGYRQHAVNLQNALNAAVKERDTARTQLTAKEKELSKAKDDLVKSQAQTTEAQAQLDAAVVAHQKVVDDYNAQVTELNNVIKIKDNEIQRLSDELANCDGESLSWSQHLVLGLKGLIAALNPLSK